MDSFRRGPRNPARPSPSAAPWTLDGVARPWTGEPLLLFIRAGLEPDGRLRDDHLTLPDEPPDTGQLRWAPGALDGVLTSHARGADDSPAAAAVVASIKALAERADATTLAATAETLRATVILPLVDEVLKGLVGARETDAGPRIREIGRMLAMEGPERALVKYGIALLGPFGDLEADRSVLEALGAHEEFTLFAAVALANLRAGDRVMWELAKRVNGWGRIQLVRRLTATEDPEIRAWMLRDGFRNSVMDEYLAYTCAIAGGLTEALAPADIDDALFDGATDMLAAMARGGPAEDLGDYADREVTVSRWLDHVDRRGPTIASVSAMDDMAGVAFSPELLARLEAARHSPAADAAIHVALASDVHFTFARGAAAARARGIDATDRLLVMAAAGDTYAIFDLFAHIGEDRIDEALEVMRGALDLVALGSGPEESLGLGASFTDHSGLDFILNALPRFPGRGTDFVLTALRSPVIRNRNAAIRTIRAWDAVDDPTFRTALEAARAIEPQQGVRDALDAALAEG